MLAELFLPNTQVLSFEEIQIQTNLIQIKVASARDCAKCPYCQATATRTHSRYVRTLSDLPCGEREVEIQWEARRYFCDNYDCVRLTFCEQLPEVTARYARKTKRLVKKQIRIGFDLSAEAGKRLATLLNFGISGDQIIRLIHSMPNPEATTPRILGIDDWAMRKGQTYGTILVDLEKQQAVDLLPDRKPETVAAWLKAHPGIEIISRDRGKEFIEGIALAGNKEVIEIADRFHLLKNMVEMLQRFFERSSNELKTAAKQAGVLPMPKSEMADANSAETNDTNQAKKQSKEKSYQQTRVEEVKQLKAEGLSQRAIAKKTGLARPTVRQYLFLDKTIQNRQIRSQWSKASPFLNFIQEHWDATNPSAKKLFSELQVQGFKGSYSSLLRALHNKLGVENLKTSGSPVIKPFQFSPRQAAWAIFQPVESLQDTQKYLCKALCELSPIVTQTRQLAHIFREMIEKRLSDQLDIWLKDAENSQIEEFKRFADSLRKDYKAVKAALTYSWSNGQVEGQVNRLKVIKRQMYGRASFSLLRRKVLGMPLIA